MADAKAPAHTFAFGDRVVHANKPEWGTGIVSKALNVMQNGVQSQSLTIRFERGGLKTLSTAFAQLVPAGDHAPVAPQPDIIPDDDAAAPADGPRPAGPERAPKPQSRPATPASPPAAGPARPKPTQGGTSWLDEASALPPEKAMAKLPEACSDPFASAEARFSATLDQYRFSTSASSLLDWAAAQTGLADPLSRFARHELEHFFVRYADARDAHLRQVGAELRQADRPAYDRLLAKANPAARDALRRANGRR